MKALCRIPSEAKEEFYERGLRSSKSRGCLLNCVYKVLIIVCKYRDVPRVNMYTGVYEKVTGVYENYKCL